MTLQYMILFWLLDPGGPRHPVRQDVPLQYNTTDIKDRSGLGQLVPYIRMSLITDGNYVHFLTNGPEKNVPHK